jgi:hypothetical protein
VSAGATAPGSWRVWRRWPGWRWARSPGSSSGTPVGAIVRSFGTLAANQPLPEGLQHPTLPETMSEQKRFTAMLALLAGATLTLGLVFAVLSTVVIRVCGETR